MTNPSKKKGTKYESELVAYLRYHLERPDIERRALSGTQDRGDIAGLESWTIEAKNHNAQNFAGWLDETQREQRNAGTEYGLLVVRRRMKPVGQSFAVMTLDQLIDIIIDLEDKE
jgi:hypothetical protein